MYIFETKKYKNPVYIVFFTDFTFRLFLFKITMYVLNTFVLYKKLKSFFRWKGGDINQQPKQSFLK